MAIKKFVVGSFDDEAVLFPAVKRVRRSGYKIHDVFTPFPIHGLDKALGLKDTDLDTAGFIYGITGTATALGFISWVFTSDWPLNIGGKPHFSLPAWIPITFELTVLFASVGMFLTFCYLCQMAPFVKKIILTFVPPMISLLWPWNAPIKQMKPRPWLFWQALAHKM